MDSDDVIERADLYLDELAKLSVTLARELHRRACAEKDPVICARLSLAYHTVSRGVRQSLALQQRLARERLKTQTERREEVRAAKAARKAEVRAEVVRLAWTEKPDWNTDALRARLMPILDVEAETEAFLKGPVQAHARRIAQRLGVIAPFPLQGRPAGDGGGKAATAQAHPIERAAALNSS